MGWKSPAWTTQSWASSSRRSCFWQAACCSACFSAELFSRGKGRKYLNQLAAALSLYINNQKEFEKNLQQAEAGDFGGLHFVKVPFISTSKSPTEAAKYAKGKVQVEADVRTDGTVRRMYVYVAPLAEMQAIGAVDVVESHPNQTYACEWRFGEADIDLEKFAVTPMRGLKRTVAAFGPVEGRRAGVNGTTLLSYAAARRQIYLPAYKWILDHKLQAELGQLRAAAETRQVVLLDFETNDDIDNLTKPLSHAALIVRYLTDRWPA